MPNLLNPFSQQVEVKELDDDSGWDRWQELAARQDAHFAPTVPASLQTLPAVLAAAKAAPAPARSRTVGVDDVLLLARSNNRVCPKPAEWVRVYDMLPDHPPRLMRPLVGRDWDETSSLAKRMVLREQIEWAASSGLLVQLRDLLAALPESSWHHMGE